MAQRIKMAKDVRIHPEPLLDVRPVDKGRLEEIADLMLNAYRNTPDYEGENRIDALREISMLFRGLYGDLMNEASFMILDEHEAIVSCLFICSFRGEPTLTYLFTGRDHLRKGLAKALIQSGESALALSGHQKLYLYVNTENHPALSLYQKIGFEEVPLSNRPLAPEIKEELQEVDLLLEEGSRTTP
ncbi:hypothetical protein ABB02_01440 [Clostridiaceae bacterium JG1575]|nr:hypothetical protein ABB02_01440 [Clostridiaceae bacterium JG1575]